MWHGGNVFQIADQELEAAVLGELEQVETLLRDGVTSADPLITEAAQHLVLAGGKRFRPLLTLLVGHLANPGSPALIRAAAVVELTHLATL